MNIRNLLVLGFSIATLCFAFSGQSAAESEQLRTIRPYNQVDAHLTAFDRIRDTADLDKVSALTREIWNGQTEGVDNWRLLRRAQLDAWLKLLDRVEKSIDPAFDPEDVPQINVAPPPGAHVRAGADPKSIKDPKVRQEYEVLIEKNREKAENYRLQKTLRNRKSRWTHECVLFVGNSFSDAKEDRGEVEKAVQEHLSNPKAKTEILAVAWPEHYQGSTEPKE